VTAVLGVFGPIVVDLVSIALASLLPDPDDRWLGVG
jgi:hypothetical protein